MRILEGLGPQLSINNYDHPYFGQIFLAASLSLVNFPDSLHPTVNLHSIEMLYLVPRVLMGILAVIDTFLVLQIAETMYNRRVAFIAATLFAVMPLTWILRGVLLDSIELPFILLSILFAVYFAKLERHRSIIYSSEKRIILILLSGTFLGLAIFTKAPVFTLIPLIVFIILKKGGSAKNKKINSSLKILGIWFIPVMLIPMIWPGYAISMGQFGQWLDGVIYQTGRQGSHDLMYSLVFVSQIDPVLVTIGLAGLVYAGIKKDFFVVIWALPYLMFLYLIGWVIHFHWSMLLPLLCIAVAAMADGLRKDTARRRFISLLPLGMVYAVVIFGLVNFLMMSTSNLNATYNQVYLFVARELVDNGRDLSDENDEGHKRITLIGDYRATALIWITKYIFDTDFSITNTNPTHDNFTPVKTKKFLIMSDSNLVSSNDESELKFRLINKYYNSSQTIATFIDKEGEKSNFMNMPRIPGFGRFVEVRANY